MAAWDAFVEAPLVPLDQDHPGFRDNEYRLRRNQIAWQAAQHRLGQSVAPVSYTKEEHEVWNVALSHLAPLHARHGLPQFKEGWQRLAFSAWEIPQFDALNQLLRATGFTFVPVAGLVTPHIFLAHLAERRFLSTQYMRHHSAPLYTPEPDVIHELVGHAALLLDPEFAALNQRFGQASLHADEARMEALIRLYWHTIEFGVVRERGKLCALGAGLYSSFGELERVLGPVEGECQSVEQDFQFVDLVAEEAAATAFDPTRYQTHFFVGASLSETIATIDAFLSR